MTAAGLQLTRAALVDAVSGALAISAFAMLLLRRVNPAWLMAIGAVAGIVAMLGGR
jgi:hypothetical protein